MGRAHEVRAASMAKTAAIKTKLYSRFGKELYMAAKAGIPDPEMNQGLKRKIAEAKANQVPADVIKRAIEKAKGSSNENYDPVRYEGFGPGASTIVIDCLTDNVNRTVSAVKTCFNKAHAKLGVAGCVSHSYDTVGLFSFSYEEEETMLDALISAEVDVVDLEIEDGIMSVYTAPTDFGKAQKAIEDLIPEVKFDVCEITLLPQEYVQLDSAEDKELWDRLVNLLNDVEDVQQIYHNVQN
ncbi:MAG: YebC/PmpR family DNA-binding transcriptional regulator [Anaerorhabdus sp.]|uniref:YebC/PmpR family DNA-binding transcriptional regulator n=1 Tax=Anaerorhabdus sp. TaxID=1872524 RepID=UPI003A845766